MKDLAKWFKTSFFENLPIFWLKPRLYFQDQTPLTFEWNISGILNFVVTNYKNIFFKSETPKISDVGSEFIYKKSTSISHWFPLRYKINYEIRHNVKISGLLSLYVCDVDVLKYECWLVRLLFKPFFEDRNNTYIHP